MENLFGKGLSAYPSGWTPPESADQQIELGCYVEVVNGPYAELHGVITYLEREYAWARLDGDAYDLRFRRDLLRRID